VVFGEPDPGVHDQIDAAYHRKYDRYGPSIVDPVVGEKVVHATLPPVPAADSRVPAPVSQEVEQVRPEQSRA
jgi:hypothetical protein